VNMPITIVGSGRQINAANGNIVVGGALSGTGGLTTTGSGTVTLAAANNYSGDTRIAMSTLAVSHQQALQGTTVDMNAADSGTLALGVPSATLGGLKGTRNLNLGSAVVSVGANNQNTTYSGNLSGAGSLNKVGGGSLNLAGTASNFGGGTTVTNGVLAVSNAAALGANGSTVTLAGGTLRLAFTPSLPAGSAGNLIVQLDATNLASNGGSVSTWTNLATVGSVGNFVGNFPGVASYNPSSATYNGLPAVQFSNGPGLINTTNFGNNVTVIFVGALEGTQNRRLVSGLNNNWLLGYWGGYQDVAYFNAWLTPQTITSTTAPHIYEGTIDAGGIGVAYSNGTVLGSLGGVQGPNGLGLGNGGLYPGEWSNGSIGELLVYNSVLSSADRAAVESYLNSKWLLPTPRLSHPVTVTADSTIDLSAAAQSLQMTTLAIGSQTLHIAGSSVGGLAFPGGTTLSGNPTFDVESNHVLSLGAVTDGGSGHGISKAGTGRLLLASAGYTGATTIQDGAVNIAAGLPAASALVFAGTGGSMPVLETNGTFNRTIGAGAGNVKWTGNGGFAALGGPLNVQLNAGTGTLDWTATIGDNNSLVLNSTKAVNVVNFQNGLNLGTLNRTIAANDNPNSSADMGTLSGVVSGSGGITKTGPGTLILAGANTFTGGVTLNAGSLQLANSAALSSVTPNSVAFTANSSGVLQLNGNSLTVSGLSSADPNNPGSSAVENANAKSVVLTVNKATGLTDTFAGTLRDGTGGSLGLTKAGPGALILAGSSTYTGPTTVTGGTLQGSAASLPTKITLAGGASLIFNQTTAGSFNRPIIGTGSVTKTGGGVLTLGSLDNYSGATTISQGTLRLGSGLLPPVPGYARWFDASNLGLADGTEVPQWNDGSTNADNASVFNNHVAPTYIANAGTGTGLGALQFTAGGATSGALQFAQDSNIRTVFSIFKGSSFLLTDVASGAYNFHRNHLNIDGDPTDPLWEGNPNYWTSSSILTGTTSVNGVVADYSVTNMPVIASQNGYNLVALSTTGPVIADSFNSDRDSTHSGDQSQAEVLIYDFPLSSDQMKAVEDYLSAKWFLGGPGGGKGSLPATSPVVIAAAATLDVAGNVTTIGPLSGAGSVTLGSGALTVNSNGTDSTFSGVISGAGDGGLTKTNAGSLTLNGSAIQAYTGPTAVLGGALVLDYSNLASPTNMLPNSALTLGGGALRVVGKTGATNSQAFASTALVAGDSAVQAGGSGATTNISLGTITRSLGATIDLNVTAASGTITTTNANTDGILGGWATYGGDTWAQVTAGAVSGLPSGSYQSSFAAATNNVDVTAANSSPAGSPTVNTLRFNGNAAVTLTVAANQALTLNAGGILVTPAVGAHATTITGGILQAAAGSDLVLIQNNTSGALTINSAIADDGASGVTKSGPGALVLGGANTFAGPLTINGGNVSFSSAAASGTYPVVFGSGSSGVLQLLGKTITLPGLGGSLASPGSSAVENGIASPAGTLIISNSADYSYGGVLRDGTASAAMHLVKNGNGTQVIAGNNTFTGGVTINAGVLQLGSTGALNATTPNAVTFATGGSGILRLAGNSITLPGLVSDTSATVENASLTPATLTVAGGGSFAGILQNGSVGGALSLTKSGLGTLLLSGNNTFTGGVTINSGNLQMGSAGALNSTTPNSVTFAANSTGALQLNGNSVALGGLSADAVNPGSPAVENANLSGATLQVNQPAGIVSTFPGTIRDGTGGGALALTMSGGGTLNLTGVNNFTGGVTLGGGVLGVGSNTALGSSTVTLMASGGGIQAVGGPRTIANPMTGTNMTVAGNNNVTLTGAFDATIGNTTITAANSSVTTFSNTIVVGNTYDLTLATAAGAGTLSVANVHFLGNQVSPNSASARPPLGNTLFTSTAPGTVLTVGSLGSGPGVLDNGSIYLTNGNRLRITGANNLGGEMIIGTDSGVTTDPLQYGTTLEIGSNDALGNASTVFARNIATLLPWDQSVYCWAGVIQGVGGPHTLSAGGRWIVSRNNLAFTGDNLTFNMPVFIRSAGAHTWFVNNTTTLVGGIYQQNGGQSLIKAGSGTLVVGGTSSSWSMVVPEGTYGPFVGYTGPAAGPGTTVQAGTLRWATSYAMPTSGSVNVASGATLAVNLGGTNEFTSANLTTLMGNTLFNSGSTLALDTTDAAGGSFTYAGALNNGTTGGVMTLAKVGANTLVLSGANTYSGGTDVLAGTLDVKNPASLLDGSSLWVGSNLSAFTGGGVATSAASSGGVSAVPEPGTLALLGALAVCGVAVHRRQRRHRKA
jgi:fibronectin-binding autotransporter adhesin